MALNTITSWAIGLAVVAATAAPVGPMASAEGSDAVPIQAGIRSALPEPTGLTCDEMRWVLDRLDQSGYRGAGPLGPEHRDFAVFAYEDRLARIFYRDCTLRASRLPAPERTAFFSHAGR
ncbi:MAG: hypothetical protein ACFBSD_02840 [Paracoccaceae bacterium]